MVYSGEYGGSVIRTFSGDGKKWIAGAILTPEDVATWPLGNRVALHKEGKVDWFGPPVEAEQAARKAGTPAPRKRTTSAAPEKKVTPPAAPRRARR